MPSLFVCLDTLTANRCILDKDAGWSSGSSSGS